MYNVQNIRDKIASAYMHDKRVGNTVEIIGATFIADEPVIFGSVNSEWNEREYEWYKSISLNVNDINGNIPKIWKDVATPDGMINSNYGWAIWSNDNGAQYYNVLNKLKADKNTRQGQMIYTRPSMHTDWCRDGMKDFMCTAFNQFFIRDDKLVSHYVMRSNDLVYGYKGDSFWAKKVQEQLAKDLGIECGDLIWTVSSAHVYDRHWHLIEHYIRTGEFSMNVG